MKMAIAKGWYCKRIALYLWSINVGIGLYMAAQFYHIFQTARAGDWQHLGWRSQWDHALVQDFFFAQRDAVELLKFEFILLIPIFIMIKIFMAGGILYCGKEKEVTWSAFWHGGSRLFLPFLINFLLFIFLIGIATLAIAIPGLGWAFHHLESVGDERGALRIIVLSASLYIPVIIYLIGSSAAAKSYICQKGYFGWRCLRNGLRIGFTRFFKMLEFFFGFLVLSLMCLFLVQWFVDIVGYQTWIGLIIVILIQQLFVLMRGLLRMMYLYGIQNVVEESTTF